MLLLALELTNDPLSLVFFLLVLSCLALNTLWDIKSCCCSVFRQLELSDYLGCCLVLGACCFNLQGKLQFVWAEFVDEGVDAERCLIVSFDAVIHD